MLSARDSNRRPFVLAIGPFPPPVHGASLVTQYVVRRISEVTNVRIANVSSGRFREDFSHHAVRPFRILITLAILIFHRRRIEAVYFSISGGLGQLYDFFLILTCRILGCAIFLHHHSFAYVDNYSLLFKLIQKSAGPSATHICLCEGMAKALKTRYPGAEAYLTVSNAALVGQPTNSTPRSAGGLVFGHLSNLTLEKGLDTVLETLRRCIAQKLPVRLVLAGPTTDNSIRDIVVAAQAEFGSALDYRGPIYGSQKSQFFSDIDIFLFPTRYRNETQPLVILESLAASVPVVASARGCIADDLGNAGTVTLNDDEFLQEAITMARQAIESPAWLRQISKIAAQRSHTLYRLSDGAFKLLTTLIAGADRTDIDV